MRIEYDGKPTEAFYREFINIQVQIRTLLKKPKAKLSDYFAVVKRNYIIIIVLLAVIVLSGFFLGFDVTTLFGIAALAYTIFMTSRYMRRLNTTLKNYLGDSALPCVTLDENGIALSKEGSDPVSIPWDSIAFVRVFNEGVCFAGPGIRNNVIFVPIKYKDELLSYMSENGISVNVIEN